MASEAHVSVSNHADIVAVRQQGRVLAVQQGFAGSDVTFIMTAISEVARNIVEYAQRGEVTVRAVLEGKRRGILVIARDHGPGIADIALAMQDGYSTTQGLGLGLPGARRLMDEFQVISAAGEGTTVTMKKWAV